MILLNHYGVDMGTSGLIIQAQSREEIYVDKLLAFALRKNRIKCRDLWDILWLHQQGIKPKFKVILDKIRDRNITLENFLNLFDERKRSLTDNADIGMEFKNEMLRFLPMEQSKTLEQAGLWGFIVYLMDDLSKQIRKNTI
jgi:hypothetical protein